MDFDADSPIRAFDRDELQFSQFARGLAKEIVEYDRPASFVIGVDGPWGSGKTSLINLVQVAVEELTHEYDWSERPLVFRFSPWLVGNRESLLRDFLPQLARELREQVPWSERSEKAKDAIRALRRYGRAAHGVETGLNIATATATLFGLPVPPFLAPLANLIGLVGQALGQSKQFTLDELRETARKSLEETEIRVLVVLDDLDRLEPNEVLSICRLVRSTVDLPHIAFLIAYDREKSASYIQRELGVDGQDYLEKVVQLPVDVPPVTASDLARMLAERLQRVFPTLTDAQNQRISKALWIHLKDLLLESPRDVGRTLNQVTFAWGMMNKEADPGDLLIVSALRIKAPRLLRWARDYCDTFFNDRTMRFNKQPLVDRFNATFAEACAADRVAERDMFDCLSDYLPGMGGLFSAERDLFGDQSGGRANDAIREKRLASEQHWQSYFDLTPGRYGFTESWYHSFVADAGEDPDNAGTGFLQLVQRQRPTGGTYAEYLIDRIRVDAKSNTLSEREYVNLFRLLTTIADDADKAAGPERSFLAVDLGRQMEWASADLLRVMTSQTRLTEFLQAIRHAKSLAHVMDLARGEMMRHGRNNGKIREDRQIIDADQLKVLCDTVRERLVAEAREGALLQSHDLAIPLLAWRDAGFAEEMRDWVVDITEPAENLLLFVEKLKQRVVSSEGNYWKISASLLGEFTNVDDVQFRLGALATSPITEIAARANECLQLLSRDRDD